jgi:hypothetical protein
MRNNLFPMAMILLLMSSLLVFSVSAYDSYTKIGDDDQKYDMGTGFWNDDAVVNTQATKTGVTSFIPLIYDFDSDGDNEIASYRGNVITIYEGKTLDIQSGYTMPVPGTPAPLYAYDIDDDGNMEIIATKDSGDATIRILSYNGTALNLDNTINYSGLKYYAFSMSGEIAISCAAANSCMAAGFNAEKFFVFGFDSTQLLQGNLSYINGESGVNYFPYIRNIASGDYNNDGSQEYVVSFIKDLTTDRIDTFWLNPSYNGSFELEYDYDYRVEYTMAESLSGRIKQYLTSPMLYDFDSGSPGLETAVGYQRTSTAQVLYMYDYQGNLYDRYPQLTETTGSFVSNIMIMKPRPESIDYACMSGYDTSSSEILLTCGSPISGYLADSTLYSASSEIPFYNTSKSYGMTNRINNVQDYSSGYDIDEIFASSGVYELDDSSCSLALTLDKYNCDMSNIFSTSTANVTIIQVDFEKNSKPDLITLQNSNIWYLDDGFTNTKGNISYYEINPCLGSTWKVNTSVSFAVTGTDIDGDSVQATAWYDGNYIQLDWLPTGTTFPFSFVANRTGVISFGFSVRDSENNNTNTTFTFTNPVSETGVESGDCVTTNYFTSSAASTNGTTAYDTIPADSNLVNGLEQTSSLLGMSVFLLYILIMGVVALGMFIYLKEHSIGAIAIVEALMLIFGVKLGIIGYGIIIFISIIGIIVIGVWLSSRFMGNKGGG